MDKFNDLPLRYEGNVNKDPPFGGVPGGKPALNPQEIDDIFAFLGTLTDGWLSSGSRAQSTSAEGELTDSAAIR